MNRKNWIYLSALFCLVILRTNAYATDGYVVSGAAYDLKTGRLVYRELFTKLDDAGYVRVNYAKPDGIIFARKSLNYSTEVFQPGVEFNDERDEEMLSATFDAGRLLLSHKRKDDSQTKAFYETARLVIDVGVDAFIQREWAKLTAGKKIEFDVADPRQMAIEKRSVKEIDFNASPLADKDASPTWIYFRVDRANKFSNLFSQPMFYAYDPKGKFLMRYQGQANIDNDTGDVWEVRIEYEYLQ